MTEKDLATFFPCWDNLKSVDQLRIETRRDLNANSCWNEKKIKVSQVPLSVPRNFVFLGETCDDGIDCGLFGLAALDLIDESHICGMREKLL